jgi:ribosomal-protein-alanine N-acetyltransferase
LTGAKAGPFISDVLIPPETYATARLKARIPRREDAAAVFAAYASDPEATRYLTWKPYTKVEPLAEFFAQQPERWAGPDRQCNYLLCPQATDTPIGSISVNLAAPGKALFGYVLGRAHWGRGYVTEALRYLVDWALAQPEIHRAWAFCDVDNPASARVMEKAGMTREGILRRWHIAPNISPEPRDCIVCAKVR